MIIKKIEIRGFGKVTKTDFNLSKGFNIIFGVNEAGKSTLHQLLLAFLYGLDKKERNRWKPWFEEEFGGALVYQLSNGEEFRIESSFLPKIKTSVFDRFGNDITKNFPVNKAQGTVVGNEHLGISRDVFMSSCFIGQNQIDQLGNTEEMKSALQALRDTSTEKASAKKAKELLEGFLKNEIGKTDRGKKTNLGRVSSEIRQLEQEKERIVKIMNNISEKESYRKDLNNKVKNEKQRLEKLEYMLNKSKYLKLRNDVETITNIKKEISLKKQNLAKLDRYKNFPIEKTDELKSILGQIKILDEDKNKFDVEIRKLKEILKQKKKLLTELERFSRLSDKDFRDLDSYMTLIQENEKKVNQERTELKKLSKEEQAINEELERYKPRFEAFEKNIVTEIHKLSGFTTESEKQLAIVENEDKQIINEIKSLKTKRYVSTFFVLISITSVALSILLKKIFIIGLTGIVGIVSFIYILGNLRQHKKLIKQKSQKDELIVELGSKVKENKSAMSKILKQAEVQDVENFMNEYQKYQSLKNRVEQIFVSKREQIIKKLEGEMSEYKTKIKKVFARIQIVKDEEEISQTEIDKIRNNYISYTNISREVNAIEKSLTGLADQLASKEKEISKLNKDVENIFARAEVADVNGFDNGLKLYQEWNKKKQKIENLEAHLEGIEGAEDVEALNKEVGSLQSFLDEIEKRTPDVKNYQVSTKKVNEYDKEMKIAADRIHQLGGQIKELEGGIRELCKSIRPLDDLDRELDERNKRYKEVEFCRDAVEKALEIIDKVEGDFHAQYFSPEVDSTSLEILPKIGIGYTDIKIDTSFDIKLLVRGLGYKDIKKFSTGTISQVYLTIRMALCRVLSETREKFPLFLDETFSNCDEQRWRQIMNFIIGISNETQVIYFTCHSHQFEKIKEILHNKKKHFTKKKTAEFHHIAVS